MGDTSAHEFPPILKEWVMCPNNLSRRGGTGGTNNVTADAGTERASGRRLCWWCLLSARRAGEGSSG